MTLTSPPYPAWAGAISTLLPACAHMLVTGNTADIYLVPARSERHTHLVPCSFVEVVQDVLAQRDVDLLVTYDISRGATVHLAGVADAAAAARRAGEILGDDPVRLAPAGSLNDLARLVALVSEAPRPVGLIVRSASRLILRHWAPATAELEFFRDVDHIARSARPGPNLLYNPVLWLLDREQDVPAWFIAGNEKVRSLVVPFPDAGERRVAAEMLIRRLPSRDDASGHGRAAGGRTSPAAVLAAQTAGLSLAAIGSVVEIAGDQGWCQEQIADAARAYRVGVLDDPWRRPDLPTRLRRERRALAAVEADPDVPPPDAGRRPLVHRVVGQEGAVRKALEILVRSAAGLSAVHTGPGRGPRAVLLLAGPPGAGKTELAKGLAELIFEDERFLVRFDLGELSTEHVAERLAGTSNGGEQSDELVSAVLRQPCSLVLFDGIEKAHPPVLDMIVQLLDEGHLAVGPGQTPVHFTESVVVLTANLRPEPEAVASPEEHRGVGVVQRVTERVEELFDEHLGRPDLFDRIGENTVVFDVVRAENGTGARLTRSMVRTLLDRVRSEHGIDVVLAERAQQRLLEECLRPEALVRGARGIGSRIETVLANPLSAVLVLQRDEWGSRLRLVELACRDGTWSAETERLAPAPARPALQAGPPGSGSPSPQDSNDGARRS